MSNVLNIKSINIDFDETDILILANIINSSETDEDISLMLGNFIKYKNVYTFHKLNNNKDYLANLS